MQRFITDSDTIKKVLGIEVWLIEDVMFTFNETDLFESNSIYENTSAVIWGDFLYHFDKEQLLTILNEIDENKYGNKDFRRMKRELRYHNTVMKKLNLLLN